MAMQVNLIPNIRIVLVGTTHPGNIGAAARAMKAMGITDLVLVSPRHFPSEEAIARATAADDILNQARVVNTLSEAIADCHLVIGTSAQVRSLPWPMLTMREMGMRVRTESASHPVAIVFGRESSGLNNDELALCQYHVQVPTYAGCSSLNLAAAVQIFCYEIMMAESIQVNDEQVRPVAVADMEQFYTHLFNTLVDIKFMDPAKPKLLRERLRRLFNRTRPDHNEMNILRGILAAINDK